MLLVPVPEATMVQNNLGLWDIVFHPDTPETRRDRALDIANFGITPGDLVDQSLERAESLLRLINRELNPQEEPTPSYSE